MFVSSPARRPHLQASGGDLRAACDEGEGGGRQTAPPPHGAYQSGAGSGEDLMFFLLLLNEEMPKSDQWL